MMDGRTGEHGAMRLIRQRLRLPSALRLPFLAGLAMASGMAHARDYVSKDIGAWTIAASSDRQGCFLTRTYPAPRMTTLLLGIDRDGSNRLTILNANWSIREKERLNLDFRLSKASFPQHLAIGIAADGKRGFVTSFGKTFPTTFATSAFLNVRRGAVRVEELDLSGSGAAVAELRRCVDLFRASDATDRRSPPERNPIPIDPFADNPGSRSRK